MFSRMLKKMERVILSKEANKWLKMIDQILTRSYFSCFSTLTFQTWYLSRQLSLDYGKEVSLHRWWVLFFYVRLLFISKSCHVQLWSTAGPAFTTPVNVYFMTALFIQNIIMLTDRRNLKITSQTTSLKHSTLHKSFCFHFFTYIYL